MADVPRLTRRPWEDVARDLEEYLKKLKEAWGGGIPPGYAAVTPETVEAGDTGSPGAALSGWVAADHEHPVITGAPSGLANTTAEGSATAIPRLDHQHKRDVRAKEDGADIGTRNALDFRNSGLVVFNLTDDPGNDEVDVEATFSASALIISRGGTLLSPTGAQNVEVWRAPYSAVVTNVRAIQIGGTPPGTTINARRNGVSTHLASDHNIAVAGVWEDGGTVQNTAYVAGDKMELMITGLSAPKPSQVAVQVDLTRA